MRRKAALFPGDFSLEPLGRIWTVRQFDEAYTAPHHGFARRHRLLPPRQRDARRSIASACPTLILTAENDPFVPPEPFRDPAVTGNPHITTVVTPRRRPLRLPRAGATGDYDGYWAEREVVRFATAA